jgi:Putative serine esterase (DUF676)
MARRVPQQSECFMSWQQGFAEYGTAAVVAGIVLMAVATWIKTYLRIRSRTTKAAPDKLVNSRNVLIVSFTLGLIVVAYVLLTIRFDRPDISLVRKGTLAKHAVVFVHGWHGDASGWNGMISLLNSDIRFRTSDFFAARYPVLTLRTRDPIEDVVEVVKTWIDEQTDYSDISIVAHSLGGLVARAAVSRSAGNTKVSKSIVTFGSPLAGSEVTVGAVKIFGLPADALSKIHPSSMFLKDTSQRWLNHKKEVNTKHHCVASNHDVVVPRASATYLCDGDPLVIEQTGHTELVGVTSSQDARMLYLVQHILPSSGK